MHTAIGLGFFFFFLPGFLAVAAVLSDSSPLSLEPAAVDVANVDAIDTKNAMWTAQSRGQDGKTARAKSLFSIQGNSMHTSM